MVCCSSVNVSNNKTYKKWEMIMPKFRNGRRFLLIRNALYSFCKIHDLKVKIMYNQKTHLMTFEIEDTKNDT